MQALMGLVLRPIGKGDRNDPRLSEARKIAQSLGARSPIGRIDGDAK